MNMQRFSFFPAVVATFALFSAGPAAAQSAPLAAVPSYATSSGDETIRGTISAIPGKYELQLRDERGFIDNVALHQGTIINPTGVTLQTGMQVTVVGANAGATFNANEIDTPYTLAVVPPEGPFYGSFGWGFGGGWGFGPRFRTGLFW
jgi:hypothetical protein